MRKLLLCICEAMFWLLCGVALPKALTFHHPMAWVAVGICCLFGITLMLCLYYGLIAGDEGTGAGGHG